MPVEHFDIAARGSIAEGAAPEIEAAEVINELRAATILLRSVVADD